MNIAGFNMEESENSEMSKSSKKVNHRKRVENPFAKNLQDILKERGISIRVAAEMAGVSSSVVSSWLSGSTPGDLLAVQKLARSLGINFEFLLTSTYTEVDAKQISLTEVFEEEEAFNGIFKIQATRLIRKK